MQQSHSYTYIFIQLNPNSKFIKKIILEDKIIKYDSLSTLFFQELQKLSVMKKSWRIVAGCKYFSGIMLHMPKGPTRKTPRAYYFKLYMVERKFSSNFLLSGRSYVSPLMVILYQQHYSFITTKMDITANFSFLSNNY